MKKINISKESIQEVIQKYPYKKDACKDLGIDIKVLNRLVKEYELSYPRGNFKRGKSFITNRPDIDKFWLIENWVNTNKSLAELSIEENIPLSTLESRVARNNLTKTFKYHVKDIIFDLTNINVWYLAGLIATDGYLELNSDAISITLKGESEYNLLSSIANYFSDDIKVITYSNKHVLRLSTNGIKEFFSSQFNIPLTRKTFNLGIPQFPNEDCAKAYIRGCIDGDGYVGKTKFKVTLLTASNTFIDGIIQTLNIYLDLDIHKIFSYRNNKTKCYPTMCCSGSTAKKILEWIYDLDNCFKLERKYDDFYKLMI
jgi:hypothetical protein